MKPSTEVAARAQEIEQMTTAFCKEHLTEEYAQLCKKLINKVLRSPSSCVLVSGRPISIAAGIVQVISVNNFLSKSSIHPFTTDTIAETFGISAGNISAKASLIRKAANVKPFHDPAYGSPEAMDNSLDLRLKTAMAPMIRNLRKLGALHRSL